MLLKKISAAALLLTLALAGCKKKYADPAIDPALNPIETAYTAAGPEAVSTTVVRDNAGNNLYIIYYPTRLAGPYPVVTWGNGTGQLPPKYANTLRHLASWGYLVIDNYDVATGPGVSVLASAQYLVAQNSTPGSPFYGKVDVARIAAAGHSQGGSAVINASSRVAGGSIIKTIVPIAVAPNLQNHLAYQAENIRVPVFFISGDEDDLLSPPNVSKVAYDLVPARVPAARGVRLAAGHDSVIDDDRKWGYLTAWLQYQLRGDQQAAQVFTGSSPELVGNTRWTGAMRQTLP